MLPGKNRRATAAGRIRLLMEPFRGEYRLKNNRVPLEWVGVACLAGESPGGRQLRGLSSTKAKDSLKQQDVIGKTSRCFSETTQTFLQNITTNLPTSQTISMDMYVLLD